MLDILSSRAIHEMVVDRLGAAVVLGKARLPVQTLDPQSDQVQASPPPDRRFRTSRRNRSGSVAADASDARSVTRRS